MINSIRKKYISFRVSEKEKVKILEKARKSGMSVSDYCFHTAMGTEITVIDTSDIKELTKELNYLGNNFNQGLVLVKQGKVTIINIEKLISTQTKIWEVLGSLKKQKRQ